VIFVIENARCKMQNAKCKGEDVVLHVAF
jgi:hypothetical protein